MPAHVTTSESAAALIRGLRELHGPLLFHLSGGCCDGTAPMCLRQCDFHLASSDVLLGEVEGVPFYTAAAQAERLENTELLLEVVECDTDSFSLEAGGGLRFIARTLSCAKRPAGATV